MGTAAARAAVSTRDTGSIVAGSPWPLRLATWNIHAAVGSDGRFMPSRIADVLHDIDADIVALQEVPLGGRHWPNVLTLLAQATRCVGVEGLSFSVGGRQFGNAILSRYPVVATRRIDLSFGSREPRGALDADIFCHGHRLRVVATHLGLHAAERRAQVQRLLQAVDTEEMGVVLMGDVNEWFVWGKALRRLISHFQAVPAPATFPSRWPVFALDRIWVRPRHRLVRVHVHRTADATRASDHLPLVAMIGD
jgi:endonuclease/exonuclease/phosphatase family metal-dependent hydrolase